MKSYCLLVLIELFALTSCKKLDLPEDTPSCIKKKIKKIQSEDVRDPPASVWQYDYKRQTVYYIPPYCCDGPSQLFDSDCNQICSPDGGLTGVGDGKCPDFSSERENEQLIWQDDRE